MLMTRFLAWAFSVSLIVLSAGMVSGQTYPNKPIRIFTSAPGGANDFTARIIAQGLTGPLGQPVIVENRPSVIAAEVVSKAPPDGYTLFLGASTFLYGSLLGETPYDPVRDFSPITLATRAPYILFVHPSLPVKSVKELIALAKAKPGVINYASGGSGSGQHLGAELFKAMAGVNMVRIPYKGEAQALYDLTGGHVELMFAAVTVGLPYMKSGRLRALAITGSEPSELAPGLPTVAASGLPGFELASLAQLWAPAKLPVTISTRLSQEIALVLKREDVKEKFFSIGVETVGSSPEQLAIILKSEIARMGKVIKDAGIRAD